MSRSRFRYFKKLVSNFHDDEHKQIFYLRDCFIPRFGDFFIREAHKAVETKSADAKELLAILLEYRDIVYRNENVSDEYKKFLSRTVSVAEGRPITQESFGTYQSSLDQCYRSTSWMITRPLRGGIRRLRGLPPEEAKIPYDEESARVEFSKVMNSASWKISAPMRAVKRVATRRPRALTNS